MKLAVFDGGRPSPCPAPFNLAEYVLAAADEIPDKIALAIVTQSGAERWSYSAIRRAVLGTATGLRNIGIKSGDRILMRLGNSVDFPIAYLAALTIDAIPVPTSIQLTQPETDKIVAEVQPALCIAVAGVALPSNSSLSVVGLAALRDMRSLPPAQFERGDPDRPGYIIYTSGTEGRPRAVTHAHRAIWARRMMWDDWYGLQPTDRVMHAGAFNWTYTLGTGLMDPWTIGATALIPSPEVTPAQLPLLLKRHDATIFAAAPGVYRQMLRASFAPLPKLRHGLSAGEKLPASTRSTWERVTGTEVHEAFGMSECSTFISASPDAPAAPGSLGRPQTGRRVAILGEGAAAAFDTAGKLAICTGDPGLMLGYWSREIGGPKRISGDWFVTNDTMEMAQDGSLTYLGRDDDMMNAGGFRVSPLEVETVFNAHPAIMECAAAEVMVRKDASVITLFYVSEFELPIPELDRFASINLARYKQPRKFVRLDSLPKNPNGKIQRRALRQNQLGT